MNWVIYIFGSGAAFFAGVGMMFAGAALLGFCRRKWSTTVATLFALIGLILIAVSATPLPYWFYVGSGIVSLVWLVTERCERSVFQGSRRWLLLSAVVLWSAGTLAEIPYHFGPSLIPVGHPPLYVFADSVTAGMGESSVETWPQLLAQSHSIKVQDYSQMGAKVHSMLRKAEGLTLGDGIVLLEIGGNDLLGSTSGSEFERDLDQLLAKLCRDGRIVVMFELPLPPFSNEFGRIQRRLASRYRVHLIPKRIFVGVLTANGATVDSVHLTRNGHKLMAETIWSVIKPAYEG